MYYHSLRIPRHSRVVFGKKTGVYYGLCRHTERHWRRDDAVQMAWVHVDGNKHWSKVPYNKLRFETKRGIEDQNGHLCDENGAPTFDEFCRVCNPKPDPPSA